MPKVFALAVLALLAGCAQPSPLFPKPPAPPVVASTLPEPTATPMPKTAAGEVRLVGESKDESCCTSCWTLPEILAALTGAALFALALVRLYRRRSGK